MHKIQEKLLNIIGSKNLSGMTLREIGNLMGEKSAQKIKHHLTQLSKKGFIVYNSAKKEIRKAQEVSREGFVSLPIVGAANCEGDSMNKANFNGKNIEDGDFVIVDSEQKSPESGHYVVSIIDEVANIKKFVPDPKNKRIILRSESSKEYLPIFIHEDDKYEISGRVVGVIKK